MAARLQHLLLCVSVAVLLVPSCCNASRTAGTRSLLPSTSASEDDAELPTNDADPRTPTSAKEREIEFNQWARFQQVQEVAIDYTPPGRKSGPRRSISHWRLEGRASLLFSISLNTPSELFHVAAKCKSSCGYK